MDFKIKNATSAPIEVRVAKWKVIMGNPHLYVIDSQEEGTWKRDEETKDLGLLVYVTTEKRNAYFVPAQRDITIYPSNVQDHYGNILKPVG